MDILQKNRDRTIKPHRKLSYLSFDRYLTARKTKSSSFPGTKGFSGIRIKKIFWILRNFTRSTGKFRPEKTYRSSKRKKSFLFQFYGISVGFREFFPEKFPKKHKMFKICRYLSLVTIKLAFRELLVNFWLGNLELNPFYLD